MTERFEWIEPEEVKKDRLSDFRHWLLCAYGSALCVPASVAVLLLSEDLVQGVPIALTIFSVSFYPLAVRWQMSLSNECHYRLRRNDKRLWKYADSFEITDHSTLPNIRCLTIHRQKQPHKIQLDFRIGQVDEAELSTFLESRIAEQRTQRLMRRVQH